MSPFVFRHQLNYFSQICVEQCFFSHRQCLLPWKTDFRESGTANLEHTFILLWNLILDGEEWKLVGCKFLEVKYIDDSQLVFMECIHGSISVELLPRRVILQRSCLLHSSCRAWLLNSSGLLLTLQQVLLTALCEWH